MLFPLMKDFSVSLTRKGSIAASLKPVISSYSFRSLASLPANFGF